MLYTVEPHEPLYNEVLDITNNFLYPNKAILFFFSISRRPTDPNFWHSQKKKEVTM